MKEELNVVMRVVRVSGTIRKAEEEAIRRAKEVVGRVLGGPSAGGGGGKATIGDVESEGEAQGMEIDSEDDED